MERSLLRSETLHRKVREIQAASSFPKPKKRMKPQMHLSKLRTSLGDVNGIWAFTRINVGDKKPYSGTTVRLMVTSSGWGSPPARRPTTYLLSSAS